MKFYKNMVTQKMSKAIGLFLSLLILINAYGQEQPIDSYIKDLTFSIDTFSFSWEKDQIQYLGKKHLAFQYDASNAVAEIRITVREALKGAHFKLLNSGDYNVIDSFRFENNQFYRSKIRFVNITESDFLRLKIEVMPANDSVPLFLELPLFAHTPTFVKFYPGVEELFVGEEKIFDLVTNHPANIIADGVWRSNSGISYKLSRDDEKIKVHIIGNLTGKRKISFNVPIKRPIINELGVPVFYIPFPETQFLVKQSPLAFLSLDISDIVFDEDARSGIEVQLDYEKGLELERTYRIEAQEMPGGMLIGEIFTRNRLSNGKVLCWLRVFNFHRRSDGYLYIKDGDLAKYLTNFNIVPKTVIQKVSILREGKDYTENLQVFPGETIEVKIEGTSLDRSDFRFEELSDVYKDTLLRSENVVAFKLKVPLDISKTRLTIYNSGRPSGFTLKVREFQKARPLDFIMLSYEEGGYKRNLTFNKVNSSIMYPGTLRDVVINPIPSRIDEEGRLYGRQFLTIKITMTNAQRQLVEMRTIENIVICPDQSSPRFIFYQDKDCQSGGININSILSIKTNELNDWSRVEIEISHRADRHNEESYTHRVEFILARRYNFDIDVSFPAGLLQIRPGRPSGEQLSSFGGVSLAALAQFSFFRPGRVAQYQPYRVGVGTIAMNAFDFSSDNADRGLALVALGSLSPTRRDPKIRLTLYFGGGYFLTNSDNIRSPSGWFLLVGPGIAVRI